MGLRDLSATPQAVDNARVLCYGGGWNGRTHPAAISEHSPMPEKSHRRKYEYKLAKLPDRAEALVASLNDLAAEGWEIEHLNWDPTTHTNNVAILRRDV